uniref:Isochorismatase-like domain-containing protein n=1 Tax=Fibrocapsa japonica TaxID=94617 RepID=A0A6U1N7F4_9STRA|mmetsp:Transcript_19212/g.27738  ORF Transcript_19212/g.27738 Transcript_19212/m.27738 type:complete len:224 (+) Transcript_19212:39-710(+)|eukprot:CAMPEP_0113935334 /NCGR_PEP_ID=MMETSP1339-20121228/2492_1 /TAXON_ID=94617 /ORGANISM="Fibrocapsa japonica" /LENGTH=223 /DNA_ID=CAMNT_0000937433 /DNA_START=39 /DNA_END=710 /DNA_ORIENTATION=+ /assembly_acc=CAM_ASM_000762
MMKSVGRLRPQSTIFLLCDIQERFREKIWKFGTVANTAKYLVEVAGELNVKVVATTQYAKALGAIVPEINLPVSTEVPAQDEEGTDTKPPPPPDTPAAVVYDKKLFSMCTDQVNAELEAAGEGLTSVVLFGIETHVCIQQTCLDLLSRGLEVHVVADGCSSQRPYDRGVALQRMARAGAFVTTAESAVFELLGTAQHPKLKAISNLTKAHFQIENDFMGMSSL